MNESQHPTPPAPQGPVEAGLSEALAQARAILLAEALPKVPGLSVAAAVGGKTIWSEQFGYADLEAKKPVEASTRFRVASISKPFTAAGLALLVERGLLDLDAPIQKYIPDFPEKKEGVITTRLLASHLSGIRHYREGEQSWHREPVPNLRTGLKIFEDDPLESVPGTVCKYSSYGYNVIGVVMEAAAKQDYLSFMAEHVFKPLGMADTRPDIAGAVDSQRAQFYETGNTGSFLIAPKVDYSAAYPAGGFLSTTDDLIRFGSAHLQPGFFKPESLKLLFTSNVTTANAPNRYGLGWFLGNHIIYHGGDNIGGASMLVLQPDSGVVLALVSNCNQFVLRSAIRNGKVPKDAEKLLFDKATIAARIAVMLAKVFIRAKK